MRIQQRFIGIVALVLVLLVTFLAIYASTIISKGFSTIEEDDIAQNIDRVQNMVEAQIYSLTSTVLDYANWDDTYLFAQTGDPLYVESNMNYETFENLGVDLMLVVDEEGTMVKAVGWSLEDPQKPFPLELVLAELDRYTLISPADEEGQEGIITIPDHPPLLFSIQPILTSNWEGPPTGSFLMAKFISDDEVTELSDLLKMPLIMHQELPATEDGRLIKGQEEVHAFTMIEDIQGEQAFILEVIMTRKVHQQSTKTLWLFIEMLILLLIVALTLTYFASRKFFSNIVLRIKNLELSSRELLKGNYDLHLKDTSKDELSDLGNSFKKMAAELKESRKKMEAYNQELEREVRSRTNDLNRKIKELEKKDALINKINTRLRNANKELKKLDEEKDMFISVAAHELKTPLTSIRGFAQLLNTHTSLPLKKRKEYLSLIDRNSERLYALVLDIVDSSRLRLGVLSFNQQTINLNKWLEELRQSMEVIFKEKHIALSFSIEQQLPAVKADQARLLQVARNLLINASKFTQPETGKVTCKVYRQAEDVRFEVIDNGTGIPKEKQAKLFSRFYQAKTHSGGSGLGLSISKGLIEAMEGRIGFTSTLGKGSTFWFTLPTTKKTPSSRKKA